LLDSTYLGDCMIDVVLSKGWTYNGTYCNMYRTQTGMNFKMAQLDQRRSIGIHVLQVADVRAGLTIQIITRYSMNCNCYVSVTTQVIPLTTSFEAVYQNINFPILSGLVHKIHISGIRMHNAGVVANQLIRTAALIYRSLKNLYKSVKHFPSEAVIFLQGILSFLESPHSNP
jgi:hypothetical protein